jgi:GT2 family glycosyltransferase
MFFESHIFKLIGGLDTRFFLDCEEEDISKRVWNFGKEVYIVPESEVIHEHGGSKDSSNDISNEYYISYKKLMFKHYNFPYAILMMVFIYLKILKDIFKMKSNMKLIKIALCGFNERFSLRYKQKSK